MLMRAARVGARGGSGRIACGRRNAASIMPARTVRSTLVRTTAKASVLDHITSEDAVGESGRNAKGPVRR